MKVLHVITGLAAGGAETQLRLLLQHSRHESDVVCLYNPGSVATQLRADGISVHDLGMRSNTELSAVPRLTRLVRAGRYDVVHTHLYRAGLFGRVAARLAGVRAVVATEHSLVADQLEGREATRGVRGLYLAAEKLGRTTIAVSRPVEENLLRWGVPPARLRRVPNGLDLPALQFDPAARAAVRARLGVPADAEVVGAVGRLHPGKRFDELLDGIAPHLGRGRHLLVVGEGPERARLEAGAQAAGVAQHVHLVGEQPVAPHLSAMDVLVSPSRYETYGLSVLEGLAAGLPVLYRTCPAVDELAETPSGAHQVDGDLTPAVLAVLAGPARDRRAPAALAAVGIGAVAAAVDDLHVQVVRR